MSRPAAETTIRPGEIKDLAELTRLGMVSKDNAFKRASSAFYVQHIAVQPSHQSAGVGRRLMSSASDLAGELGAAALRLDSWHFNVKAHDFFKSQGFAPVNFLFERRLG